MSVFDDAYSEYSGGKSSTAINPSSSVFDSALLDYRNGVRPSGNNQVPALTDAEKYGSISGDNDSHAMSAWWNEPLAGGVIGVSPSEIYNELKAAKDWSFLPELSGKPGAPRGVWNDPSLSSATVMRDWMRNGLGVGAAVLASPFVTPFVSFAPYYADKAGAKPFGDVVSGAGAGIYDVVRGFATPQNIAMAGGFGGSRIAQTAVSGYFGKEMLQGVPREIGAAYDAWRRGDYSEASRLGVGGIVSGLMGGMAAGHAVRGFKNPIAPKSKPASSSPVDLSVGVSTFDRAFDEYHHRGLPQRMSDAAAVPAPQSFAPLSAVPWWENAATVNPQTRFVALPNGVMVDRAAPNELGKMIEAQGGILSVRALPVNRFGSPPASAVPVEPRLAKPSVVAPGAPVVTPPSRPVEPRLAKPPVVESKPVESVAPEPSAVSVEPAVRPVSSAPVPSGVSVGGVGAVHGIAGDQIAVRPDLMQFKRMSDTSSGASETHRETIGGDWDAVKGGNLLLWEPKNPSEHGLTGSQKYIVADGHGRFNYGRERGVSSYNAQILREADGYTALDARIIAAEKNIVDGKGTIYDQAKFLRDTAATRGADEALARARQNGIAGKKAASIGFSAADSLWDSFINERVTPDQAAAIADAAPKNDAVQRMVLGEVLKDPKLTPEEARQMVRAMQASGVSGASAKQVDLFGSNDTAMEEMRKMSKSAAEIVGELRTKARIGRSVTTRAEEANAVGVKASNKTAALADAAGRELASWENWQLDPVKVRQVRERAGLQSSAPPRLASGEKGTGDLLKGQSEPMKLVGEVDETAKQAAAKAEADRVAAEEAKAKEEAEKQQGNLFGNLGIVAPGTRETWRVMQSFIDRFKFPGSGIPNLMREGLGIAARQHAAAKIAPRYIKDEVLGNVLPKTRLHDKAFKARVMGVINKNEVLGIYDQARERVRRLLDDPNAKPSDIDEAMKAVSDIEEAHGGTSGLDAMDAELRRAKGDPELVSTTLAWNREMVKKWMDPLYNEMLRVDPNTPREGRGRYPELGMRVNLLADFKAEEMRGFAENGMPVPEIMYSNHRNPNVKRDKFSRLAKGTGEYSTDMDAVILNSIGGRWNEVTKQRFYDAIVEAGGVITKYGEDAPTVVMGEKPVRIPIKAPETLPSGQLQYIEKSLWVPERMADEVLRVLNTGLRPRSNPILRAFTQLQMLSGVDASAHTKNQISILINSLRGDNYALEQLRRLPFVGTEEAARALTMKRIEMANDTPEIRAQISRLAQLGLIRPEYPAVGLGRITAPVQEFLHKNDTATRLILDDWFTKNVEAGRAVDTLDNRVKFVNQLGEYNRRLMSPEAAWARDVGLSPFIVAGQTFNRFGRRLVIGSPGFEANTVMPRLMNLSNTAMMALVPAMMNYFLWDNPTGRPGTKIGEVDLGDGDDGKRRTLDVFQLTGLRRGLRGYGLDAVIHGAIEGETVDEIGGKAFSDITSTALHPWLGPGVGGAYAAITGNRLDLRGGPAPRLAKDLGRGYTLSQVGEQARAAFEQQNPMLYGAVSNKLGSGGQTAPQKFIEGTFKRPIESFGYSERVREATSTAARRFMARKGRKSEPVGTISKYRDLDEAVRLNNAERVKVLYNELIESGYTPKKISERYRDHANAPFTGSRQFEHEFYAGLNAQQREQYKKDRAARQALLSGLFRLLRESNEASQQPRLARR